MVNKYGTATLQNIVSDGGNFKDVTVSEADLQQYYRARQPDEQQAMETDQQGSTGARSKNGGRGSKNPQFRREQVNTAPLGPRDQGRPPAVPQPGTVGTASTHENLLQQLEYWKKAATRGGEENRRTGGQGRQGDQDGGPSGGREEWPALPPRAGAPPAGIAPLRN